MTGARYRGWIALFLIPTLVLFALFYAIPIAIMVATSFTEWDGFGAPDFIGLENFARLLGDDAFQKAVRNSILWGLLAAFIHVPLGVLIALVISRRPVGGRLVRSASLLPNLIPPAALAIIYVFIFNPGIGLANNAMRAIGFEDFTVNWFFEPIPAFIAVSSVWLFYTGVIVLITLAEISAIAPELREAAIVDGATETQVDRHIRLPLLRGVIGVGMIIAVTEVFKMFDYVYLTTKGGPANETMSLGLLIYNQATVRYQYGYSNAVGVVLMLLGLVAFYIVARTTRVTETAR